MAALTVERRTALCLPFVEKAGWIASTASPDDSLRVAKIVAAAGDRIKVAGDVLAFEEFFLTDEAIEYEEKAFAKRLLKPEEAPALLERFRSVLSTVESFEAVTLERGMMEFVEAEGIKIGQIIHAVRVAVTGKGVGFGMFETLEILGRESCLARLDRAVAHARS